MTRFMALALQREVDDMPTEKQAKKDTCKNRLVANYASDFRKPRLWGVLV